MQLGTYLCSESELPDYTLVCVVVAEAHRRRVPVILSKLNNGSVMTRIQAYLRIHLGTEWMCRFHVDGLECGEKIRNLCVFLCYLLLEGHKTFESTSKDLYQSPMLVRHRDRKVGRRFKFQRRRD